VSDDIELDYDYLWQNALRGLMREVLGMVAEIGDAPGEHHFYIEFLTRAPGVNIPEDLKKDYAERMTIVLQHQFENLTVDQDKFAVTLWFKGKGARLEIPFEAVTSFADPSVQFGLRFERKADRKEAVEERRAAPKAKPPDEAVSKGAEKDQGDSADIVSLDSFRKK
jgi:hypothetical protein